MRTREEQIAEIKERVEDLSLVNCYPEFSEIQDWLIEDELRAEQRVRAEIGRDSERLDWLEKTRSVVLEDTDNGWRVTIGGIEFSLQEETARNAIDAAREVDDANATRPTNSNPNPNYLLRVALDSYRSGLS